MTRLILWSRDHPHFVVPVLLVISLFFGWQAKDIRLDSSTDGMMIEGDPEKVYYEQVKETFGSDNITVVYVRDENLFDYDKLIAIEEVFYALQDIPGVTRVDALYNAKNIKGEDGFLSTNPLMDWVPEEATELEAVRQDALRSPLINRILLAEDAKGLAITIVAEAESEEPDFNVRLADDIDETIKPLEGVVDRVFQAGMPHTRRQIARNIIGDQVTLVPWSVAILLTMLIIGMRTINGAILPMLTGGMSILWTVGYMSLVGIPLNVLTTIIPSLLIILGATEDMHMISEYFEGLESGRNKMSAIKFMAKKAGLAVTLTAVTTYLGFLSISINSITLLKQFGIASSFGLLVNPFITFSLVPVYLRYFGNKKAPGKAGGEGQKQKGFVALATRGILSAICDHPKVILWITGVTMTVMLGGIFLVRVDNDILGYFKPTSEIRMRSQQLHEELSGSQKFYIVLDGRRENAFKEATNVQAIYDIQKFVAQMGVYDSSISFADHIALINREMEDGSESQLVIPDKDDLISQYALFYTRGDLERYVSADYKEANILVRHNLSSSYDFKKAKGELMRYIDSRVGNSLEVRFSGEEILINKASDTMAKGQAYSLSMVLMLIFIIISALFVRFKAGLLSLVPNLVPIISLFGVMGYFGIPLNPGTAMIATIAIGIAVDDTIHLMVRYNKEMKTFNDERKALIETMTSEMLPVLVTSVALFLGFVVLGLSNFVPIIYFGLLSSMVMIFAMVSDLLITPVFLSRTKLITLWDMIGLQLKKQAIQGSSLFDGMSHWQVKKVVLLGHTREFESGDHVIQQGEKDRTMYLILDGAVKVEHVGDEGQRVFLKKLNPGDIFGEMALVSEVERTADVIATESAKVLEIDWKSLERIGKLLPRLSAKFFLNISRILGTRLAETNIQLTEKTQHA